MRPFPSVLAEFGTEFLIPAIVTAAVVAIAWKLLRPRPAFQIQIRQGEVTVVGGKVRAQFLKDLTDIVNQAKLAQGTITSQLDGKRLVLKFSREFPPPLQQQIRNTWYAGI